MHAEQCLALFLHTSISNGGETTEGFKAWKKQPAAASCMSERKAVSPQTDWI